MEMRFDANIYMHTNTRLMQSFQYAFGGFEFIPLT